MKRKIAQAVIDLMAVALILGSLVYISGQYGGLEFDFITTKQFCFRAGIGVVALGTGALLSNIRLEGS